MSEPRRYIGVRISEQGHRYIQLVADRDKVNYSEALRRLLAVGAKTDMEAHDGTSGTSAERSADPLHQRPDARRGHRDLNGDGSSGEVPHLPDSGPAGASQGIPEAIGHIVHAGFNPSSVGMGDAGEGDGPSAA